MFPRVGSVCVYSLALLCGRSVLQKTNTGIPRKLFASVPNSVHRLRARMTDDKNLTPFSIADILKSKDRGGGRGVGAGNEDRPEAAGGGRGYGLLGRANNYSDEALDMTNNKFVHKKGKQ